MGSLLSCKEKGEEVRLDSKRNCDSVKCKCGFRQLFHKDEVSTNEKSQRYIVCDKCHKEIILRKK